MTAEQTAKDTLECVEDIHRMMGDFKTPEVKVEVAAPAVTVEAPKPSQITINVPSRKRSLITPKYGKDGRIESLLCEELA